MTEAEWLVCDDPEPMLEFLRGKTSERKLRLFAVGCCTLNGIRANDERCQYAVLTAEAFADGLADAIELERARRAAYFAGEEALDHNASADTANRLHFAFACSAISDAHEAAWRSYANSISDSELESATKNVEEKAAQARLLRCVIGNPNLPVFLPSERTTATVAMLAASIYDDRAFDRLPILADALEDAGCTNRDILDHCRQPGEHVRGCWAVDLVLGKS